MEVDWAEEARQSFMQAPWSFFDRHGPFVGPLLTYNIQSEIPMGPGTAP